MVRQTGNRVEVNSRQGDEVLSVDFEQLAADLQRSANLLVEGAKIAQAAAERERQLREELEARHTLIQQQGEQLQAQAEEVLAQNEELHAVNQTLLEVQRALAASEQRARASEQQLQTVTDAVPVLISYVDADQRYQLNNLAYEHWFGHPRQQLQGRNLREVLGDAVYAVIKHDVERALAGEPVTYERELPYKDGGTRFVRASYVPDIDHLGRVAGFVALVEDITAARRAADSLTQSEARYRALFSHLSEGLAVHQLLYDAQGQPVDYRFLDVNPAFASLTGLARERVIGHTVREVLPGIESQWIERYAEIVRTGEPLRFEDYAAELKRHFHVIAYKSGPGQFATLFLDVTDDRKAAAERERLLAELDASLAAVPEGLVVYDGLGVTVRTNAAARRLLACVGGDSTLPLTDGLGAGCAMALDGKPLAAGRHPVERALAGEVVLGTQMVLGERPEEKVWLSVSAAPIRDPAGELLGVVATYGDVSALQRLQEEREDVIHMISHDLRQPLTVIQGHTQMLQNLLARREGGAAAWPRFGNSLRTLDISAKQMATMIQDMVDSARLESGQGALALQPAALGPLLRDLAGRLAEGEDRDRLQVQVDDDLPLVLADATRLERVVVNLITNAFKYSAPGTKVLLRAAQIDGTMRVEVRDHGRGIPPAEKGRLFQRYYRPVENRTADGLGLGLYISRLIVEAHGGRIGVESQVGRGSTFFFTLPLAPGESVSREDRESA